MAAVSPVLEGLSQALPRFVPHRALHRLDIDRARIIPADQPEDRQSAAPAACR